MSAKNWKGLVRRTFSLKQQRRPGPSKEARSRRGNVPAMFESNRWPNPVGDLIMVLDETDENSEQS
jgi:hypothetical protein